MPLTSGAKFVGRYTGTANGRGTYVVGNCQRSNGRLTSTTRYQARYVGLAEDGRPIYVTAPCSHRRPKLANNQRYDSRYVGLAEDGRPVYMTSCAMCSESYSCEEWSLDTEKRTSSLFAVIDGAVPSWIAQTVELHPRPTNCSGIVLYCWDGTTLITPASSCGLFGACGAAFFNFVRVTIDCLRDDGPRFGDFRITVQIGCRDAIDRIQTLAIWLLYFKSQTLDPESHRQYNYVTDQCGAITTPGTTIRLVPLFLYAEGLYPCPDAGLGFPSPLCDMGQNIQIAVTIYE